MDGRIAFEEHWALEETLEDSARLVGPGDWWQAINRRLRDVHDLRLSEMGAGRILFSVDYPFEDTVDAATWFDHSDISEADRLRIGRTNAIELFKLDLA